jgi:hypothetical protein
MPKATRNKQQLTFSTIDMVDNKPAKYTEYPILENAQSISIGKNAESSHPPPLNQRINKGNTTISNNETTKEKLNSTSNVIDISIVVPKENPKLNQSIRSTSLQKLPRVQSNSTFNNVNKSQVNDIL